MSVKGRDEGEAMAGTEKGTTTREMRSPQRGNGGACAVTADAARDDARHALPWDRFEAWPPAARLAVAVLLSLMLWVVIWFGGRAALNAIG